MNSKKFVCAIIVGLVISLFQGPLLACASSIDPKTVKVGYYENALFMEGASEDEVKTGYGYEYFMKLSEYTGWRYEYVYGSFGDLYQKLVDGEIDLLAGLAYREERADLIGYPDDAMGSETYNLIKHGDNEEITSDPTTINGHTIGVLESAVSSAFEAYLISHDLKAEIKYYNDTEDLIEAFDNGEVDLLATEGAGTLFRRNYEVISTFGLSDYYVCTNIRKPELLTELNNAQDSLFNDEPYFRSALSSKYFSDSVSMKAFSPIEKEWLEAHDTLNIGYLNNYLPYSTSGPNGKVTGVIRDVMPALLRSLNITELNINYVGFDNYDDMIAAINDETIDAAFPVGGGTYYSEQNGIYQTHPLASVSTDLIYKTVVINPNYVTFAVNDKNRMQSYYIKANYPDAVLVYYESTEECLNAVMENKVDCTTLNGLRANEILKNGQYAGLSLRQLPAKDDRGIGVKIGNEGLLRLLNRGIHILGDDYAANNAYQYVEALYTYSVNDWFKNHYVVILGSAIGLVIIIVLIFVKKILAMKAVYEGLKNSSQSQKLVIDNIANSLRSPVNDIYE
ncbi:MAG: transporter substrate-binding domain-containing protein, partial [Pseudobutyrivibrio sp.]|nr:transporter substrate-binding domain-containing protein [Pseudobutyrivibrio sp.]